MVLECADGSFGGISMVDVWRDQLQFACVCGNGMLEGCASFIVHDVYGWRCVGGLEARVNVLVRRDTV